MGGFHRSLGLGFGAAALLLVAGLDAWESRALETPIRRLPLPAVAPSLIDPASTYPGKAKRRRMFWVATWHASMGDGVDLFKDDAAFDSVYPGYQKSRENTALWDEYFRQPFHSEFYNRRLSSPGVDVVAWNSWTGNLSLFNAYGADVILFGNSQTWAAAPGLLRDTIGRVGGVGGEEPRILSFASGAMLPHDIILAASGLSGSKARVAVLAYSYNWLREKPADTRKEELARFFRAWRGGGGRLASALDLVRRNLSWSRLVWINREMLEQERQKRRLETRRVGGVELVKNALEDQWRFPASLMGHEPALEAVAAETPVDRADLPADFGGCGVEKESARLDEILAALSRVAETTLIYVPPTTPLHTDRWPACLRQSARAMLQSKASARVRVVTDDWKAYGLGYSDFARPVETAPGFHFDVSHVTLSGSEKVSARLGPLLARELARAPGR